MHGMDALMNHYFYIIDSKEMRRTDHKRRKGKEMRSEEKAEKQEIACGRLIKSNMKR